MSEIQETFKILGLFARVDNYFENEVYRFFDIIDEKGRLLYTYCINLNDNLQDSISKSIPYLNVALNRMPKIYKLVDKSKKNISLIFSKEEEGELTASINVDVNFTGIKVAVPAYDMFTLSSKYPPFVLDITLRRIQDKIISIQTSTPKSYLGQDFLDLHRYKQVNYDNTDYIISFGYILNTDTLYYIEKGTKLYNSILAKSELLAK